LQEGELSPASASVLRCQDPDSRLVQ
jgi:hypothetical protein